MPIGIVSDEDFAKELDASHVNHRDVGRGAAKAVPAELRAIIAEEAIIGNNKETALAFGISSASVSAYKNGATSTATYNQPDEQLKKSTDIVRDKIGTIAKSKLLRALSHITNEKLSEAKARDLAGIAKDMSTVVNNIQPQGPQVQHNSQFIFHTYDTREEDKYEIIDVVDVR